MELSQCSKSIFFLLLMVLFASPSSSSSSSASSSFSDSVFDSHGSTGRNLLQAKKACPVNFEFQNYTIITSQCKGPKYPPKTCCAAFKEFACPFADVLNDLTNNCASTMFSYINLYGKYPPGLFASACQEGKKGLYCPATPPPHSPDACPVNFEFQNYTIITSQCKGPKYPPKTCCAAFKEFACPFADVLNDLTNNCASTMFSYINLYGKYPPGLFASACQEGKKGLYCPATPPPHSPDACPVNFEFQNYTIITSQCKGPKYPPKTCCAAFKEFACPFADVLNDLTNNCASTMFSYINLYGKYPPGLFASACQEGKKGLYCPATPPPHSPDACPVNFEFQNYTIITSQCKGPKYPPKTCCAAFKEFACPFADVLNDLTNNCASTMFSYINLYGKYPPGLFASACQEGKKGLYCPATPPPHSPDACPVNFEFQNYTIITSQCKGPKYPPKTCCAAFKEFACPFADVLNDLTNNCASTMFSYINLYGKYPPGLFASACQEGKKGLYCPATPPPHSPDGKI